MLLTAPHLNPSTYWILPKPVRSNARLFLTSLEAKAASLLKERERERGWEVRRQKDQWKAGEREIFGPFSAVEEHLNMTGHNYALLRCWLQMHALCYNFTLNISLKGLCTVEPYNRVNAAVFEMINTKETRRKDKAAKKLNKTNQWTNCL